MATSGECDVKLEHDDFQCITPVIVAKGLAHECLIGMNVLIRWPAMKEVIRLLLKRQPEDERDNSSWAKNRQITRLNHICLPCIMADIELKSKLLSRPTTTKVTETEATTVESDQNETSLEFVVPESEESEEKAKDQDQEEFRAKYMPENREAEMAINFISTREDSREIALEVEEIGNG